MTNDPAGDAARNMKERVLIFIVVFLGFLIVAALGAVLVKIIYLSSEPLAQRAASKAAGTKDRLDLPAGAVVKSISVSGDRLAVHYEAPSGAGISVLNLATGAVLREVEVVPAR
jgi:hypothetical protein